ncbi:MAG: 30S ribosome-binding factor RbfA [Planctomycetes bacterium]|nr:30S ribosome-binding factor RbfA [Planctomycetota bacterium]
MASVAFERVRAKIKSEAARILMTDLKDPRMGFVTVIDVDLSRDFRHATIHVSILADHEGEERRILKALDSAKGFVQREIAGRLRTRTTPLIEFQQSKGAQQSIKINSLLDQLAEERKEREAREAREAARAAGEDDEASTEPE